MFEAPGKILELKRNLYGQCESPRKFYDHLKKGLQDRGLTLSPHDHCLFMSGTVSVVTYVGKCIFFSKHLSRVNMHIELGYVIILIF